MKLHETKYFIATRVKTGVRISVKGPAAFPRSPGNVAGHSAYVLSGQLLRQ